MANKYSHALVLSHYESRGLINFPNTPSSTFVVPLLSHSKASNACRADSGSSPVRTSRSSTPQAPARTSDKYFPSPHRSTASVVTEIYAPERQSTPTPHPRSTSPCWTDLSSNYPSPLSSIFDFDAALQDDDCSPTISFFTDPTLSGSASVASSGEHLPAESVVDLDAAHRPFPYAADCSVTPWENPSITPTIFRLQSSAPPVPCEALRRSPSPDDAAPPPIARHRRLPSIPVKSPLRAVKVARTSMSLFRPLLRFDPPSKPPSEPAPSPTPALNPERLHTNRSALGELILGAKLVR